MRWVLCIQWHLDPTHIRTETPERQYERPPTIAVHSRNNSRGKGKGKQKGKRRENPFLARIEASRPPSLSQASTAPSSQTWGSRPTDASASFGNVQPNPWTILLDMGGRMGGSTHAAVAGTSNYQNRTTPWNGNGDLAGAAGRQANMLEALSKLLTGYA